MLAQKLTNLCSQERLLWQPVNLIYSTRVCFGKPVMILSLLTQVMLLAFFPHDLHKDKSWALSQAYLLLGRGRQNTEQLSSVLLSEASLLTYWLSLIHILLQCPFTTQIYPEKFWQHSSPLSGIFLDLCQSTKPTRGQCYKGFRRVLQEAGGNIFSAIHSITKVTGIYIYRYRAPKIKLQAYGYHFFILWSSNLSVASK